MSAQSLSGRCLCGAVTVTAKAQGTPQLRACHCDMCRQHTSGAFISIPTDPATVQVTGPVGVYRSSEWAERGFCTTCGSTLFYRTVHDGAHNFAAGLFADAGGGALAMEFFSDQCPSGYAFAGAHQKLTTQETIALFAPDEGETQ